MSDLISRETFFEIDVTKRVLTRKGWRTLFPDLPMLLSYPRRMKSYTHLSLGEEDVELFAARVSRGGKKREEYLHVPSIRVSRATMSPINTDTGAHYTTSPSYANCEPP